MITIRKEQLDALEDDFNRRQRKTYAKRLRSDPKITLPPLTPEELDEQIEDGCVAAQELGIAETEDIYRFLRLRYIPEKLWTIPGLQDFMTKVLTQTMEDPARRLDFIEMNIAFREPPLV